MIITASIAFVCFTLGAFALQACFYAFKNLELSQSHEQLKKAGYFFFYRSLIRPFFKKHETEALLFSFSCARSATRFAWVVCFSFLLFTWRWSAEGTSSASLLNTILIFTFVVASPCVVFTLDYLPRSIALAAPRGTLTYLGPLAAFFLILMIPVVALLLLVSGKRFASLHLEVVNRPVDQMKGKIVEMIQQAPANTRAEEEEKALLESVAELPDRIVREVMVPRVDIFAIDGKVSLRKAAQLLSEEGYSRAPIYKESIDQIEGLLMYKDLMGILLKCTEKGDFSPLEEPVTSIAKPILFAPETSLVMHLLREFRQKQTHLAAVVDEYGGTEGIVTIEDCLEEIVGEISDEYDEEEKLFTRREGGGWVVDARMTILDIEESFGITIPQEGGYDTVGGYAFHRAGEIPQKGLKIHHDEFELEVLESSERCVEKVLIIPTKE